MEHYTEFTGKTSEEAIEECLKELGLKREEADIRILEERKNYSVSQRPGWRLPPNPL